MSTPKILEKTLYTAVATATGGRDGRTKSDDGAVDHKLSIPKGLGGPGGEGTNPEQLFAAGYSACFASAIGHVAMLQKVKPGPISVTAKVSIGAVGKAFGLAVDLNVALPELPREQAEALVAAAHEVCPYSNATRGNIVVNLNVE